MILRKKNIIRAFDIISVSFLVLTFFHFASIDELYNIGTFVEKKLGVHTEIDVVNMKSYVVMLFSGVLTSSLVALAFFISEYQNSKVELYRAFINENNRLVDIYNQIPIINNETEYGKLCLSYYLEFLLSKVKENESKATKAIIIDSYNNFQSSKSETRVQLEQILKDNPDLLSMRDSEKSMSINEKCLDIIMDLHCTIDDAIKAYNNVLKIDLSTLQNIEWDITHFRGYRKRSLLKIFGEDDVIPNISRISLFNFGIAEKRALMLHKRFIERTHEVFQGYSLDTIIVEDNSESFMQYLELTQSIIKAQKDIFDKIYHDYFEVYFSYNKLSYHLSLINKVLLSRIGVNDYQVDKHHFTLKRSRSIEKGRIFSIKRFRGDVVYKDLFRSS